MGGGRRLHRRFTGLRVVGFCALSVVAGCDTMRQDIGEISLKSTTPSEAARMMMDTTDPDNRRVGTVLISNSAFGGTDVYVQWYRDSVESEPNPLVRAVAVSALGRHGTPEDAVSIALRLDDEQFQVRWESAKALQRLHYPAVVPVLLATVRNEDEEPDIRVASAISLGQYPQDRVFQTLVAALDTPQLSINEAARGSLQTLTGEDHGLDPGPWLHWYNGVSNPFAGQREYLYPTYHRKESFLEKLAFWSSTTYEEPAVPTGLEDGVRRTYSDSEEAATNEGG
jgi:hypothetical protein